MPGTSTGSGPLRAGLGDRRAARGPGRPHATGTFTRKTDAPAGARDVGGDQYAAEDLAGDHGQPGRRAVQAHRLGPAVARRWRTGWWRAPAAASARPPRPARPAPRPASRRGREPAGQRGQAEGRHAAEEEPAPAEQVAEPAAEDEQHGVREAVAGDDEFEQGGLARVQVLSMVGRATLTMKKSIRGSAAPSSTVNSPRPLSAGGCRRAAPADGGVILAARAGPAVPARTTWGPKSARERLSRGAGLWRDRSRMPQCAALRRYQRPFIRVRGHLAGCGASAPDGIGHSGEPPRHELAAFLRSRRERITPEQVGLPRGRRRRTPGLRREEVAQLSAVGVTWYTWLEQARDIQVSVQVLDALARTLLLDPSERAHLFQLAGRGGPHARCPVPGQSDPLRGCWRSWSRSRPRPEQPVRHPGVQPHVRAAGGRPGRGCPPRTATA